MADKKDPPADPPTPPAEPAVAGTIPDRPASPAGSVDALKMPPVTGVVLGAPIPPDADEVRVSFSGPGDSVVMDGITFLPGVEHTLSRAEFQRLCNTPGTTWSVLPFQIQDGPIKG